MAKYRVLKALAGAAGLYLIANGVTAVAQGVGTYNIYEHDHRLGQTHTPSMEDDVTLQAMERLGQKGKFLGNCAVELTRPGAVVGAFAGDLAEQHARDVRYNQIPVQAFSRG